MKKKQKYSREMPRRLYTFFAGWDGAGAPSLSKFARSIGATTAEVEDFGHHGEFKRAMAECSEIRRDYLIDGALCKKFDASTVKFLLAAEFGMSTDGAGADRELEVRLEVAE